MDEETLTEYTLKFDELNKLGQALIDTIDRNANKEKQAEYAVDSILSFLVDAYLLGFGHTSRMLDIEE